MKILYVNPARLESGMDAIIKGSPLSLISIAAMVPEHDAKLFDFKVDKYHEQQFKKELNHYDVVAITSMTPQIYNAFEVSELAKEQGCTTLIGGYHPTLAPDFVTKHKSIDYVIRGEGEHTFKELIDYIDGKTNKTLKEIDGVSYRDNNGNIIHNKERQLEPNLDNFPMPRRDLLKGKLYTYLGTTTQQVETSRGCPHNCKFCCIIKMWRNSNRPVTYRTKSIKRIMREVYDVDWKKNNFIFFCEDNFTINTKRTHKILDTIIRSGVPSKMHFSCQSRVDTLYRDPSLIKKLHTAGFRQVFLGIESVHQQSLDAMNKKNLTPEMVRTVVKGLRDLGISIFGGVIIAFPGETQRMVRQNIQNTIDLDLDVVQFTPITAFPGTDYYDEMKEKGMVNTNNYKFYDLFHPMMKTEQLTATEIYRLVAEAYAAFYLKGWFGRRVIEYLNPLGKFNWMLNSIFRLGKQLVMGGLGMLYSQGITTKVISKELKNKKELMKDVYSNNKEYVEKKNRSLMDEKVVIPLIKTPKQST